MKIRGLTYLIVEHPIIVLTAIVLMAVGFVISVWMDGGKKEIDPN
jgi:hypothetical protein